MKLLTFENSEKMVVDGFLTREAQAKMIQQGKISTPPKMHYAPTEVKEAFNSLLKIVEKNRIDWENNLPAGQTIGKVTLNISK